MNNTTYGYEILPREGCEPLKEVYNKTESKRVALTQAKTDLKSAQSKHHRACGYLKTYRGGMVKFEDLRYLRA